MAELALRHRQVLAVRRQAAAGSSSGSARQGTASTGRFKAGIGRQRLGGGLVEVRIAGAGPVGPVGASASRARTLARRRDPAPTSRPGSSAAIGHEAVLILGRPAAAPSGPQCEEPVFLHLSSSRLPARRRIGITPAPTSRGPAGRSPPCRPRIMSSAIAVSSSKYRSPQPGRPAPGCPRSRPARPRARARSDAVAPSVPPAQLVQVAAAAPRFGHRVRQGHGPPPAMPSALGRIQVNISGEAGGGASGKATRLTFAPSTFSAARAITSAPGQSV